MMRHFSLALPGKPPEHVFLEGLGARGSMCAHIYIYIYIYTYIYTYRERERERDLYIYIYIIVVEPAWQASRPGSS